MSGPSIVISATFTADAIAPALAFWMRELGFDYRIQIAPYNQVFQLLLDPAGALAANRDGVNVVLVRFEDWGPDTARLEADVKHFAASLRSSAQSFAAPLLVCICPASPDFDAGFQTRMEELIAAAAAELSTVHLVTPRDIHAPYPVAQPLDPLGDKLGHIPYTTAYFAALATAWRAASTPSSRRRAKSSCSIATTRCGMESAARTVRKASSSIRRAARCSSSWPSGAAPATCWRYAARTTRTTCWKLSASTQGCRSVSAFRGAPHRLGAQERQSGIACRGTRSGPR